ncbi:MAG: hypothetical protein AAB214_13230 [Fibrobacterota bacterium]
MPISVDGFRGQAIREGLIGGTFRLRSIDFEPGALMHLRMFLFLGLVVALKICATPSHPDVWHVSPLGNDSADGSSARPFRTPQRGFAALDGGRDSLHPDTLYLHAGTYAVSGSQSYTHSTLHFPADHCVATAWPGDSVLLDGGESPTNFLVSGFGNRHLTLSGLHIRGVVSFMACPFLRLADNDIFGGVSDNPGLGFWCNLLFFQDNPGARIVNNTFRDVVHPSCQEGNDAIEHYGAHEGDAPENVEYAWNTFRNLSGGLFLKDNPEGIRIHHNLFIRVAGSAVKGSNQNGPAYDPRIDHNVFAHNGGAISGMIDLARFHIHNNTFHASRFADFHNNWGTDVTWEWFDNLSTGAGPWSLFMGYEPQDGPSVQASALYLDYNGYAPGTGWVDKCGKGCLAKYQVLSAWQAHLDSIGRTEISERHSFQLNLALSDTGSTDASGFRPTSASPVALIQGGRGGVWPKYMGAWDPEGRSWIGACPRGLGKCDEPGIAGGTGNTRLPNSVVGGVRVAAGRNGWRVVLGSGWENPSLLLIDARGHVQEIASWNRLPAIDGGKMLEAPTTAGPVFLLVEEAGRRSTRILPIRTR